LDGSAPRRAERVVAPLREAEARGHTFKVEAAGADDLGHEDAFVQAGTLVGGGP
jgi:hypothetical protein